MNDVNDKARAFMDAGYEFWKEVQKDKSNNGAVVWLENNETGHFCVFTRGEHKRDLINFIRSFDKLQGPYTDGYYDEDIYPRKFKQEYMQEWVPHDDD